MPIIRSNSCNPRRGSAWRGALSAVAAVLALGVVPAGATTIAAYDQLSAAQQQAVVVGAIDGIAAAHAGDAAVSACIAAYQAPSPGGAPARLGLDFQALVDRSRQVAPNDFAVEALLEGLIMVECRIPPEDVE